LVLAAEVRPRALVLPDGLGRGEVLTSMLDRKINERAVVRLVYDEEIVAEDIRRMLVDVLGIEFHY
jgi:hypothetical protein